MRKTKGMMFILAFLLTILFGMGCQKKEPLASGQQENMPVRVTKVQVQELAETLDYVGNIKAQDEAVVYPKVSGKIIEKLKVDGSAVTKGEAICYIDRDEVGLKFQRAPVESPLSGVVGRIYVDLGQNVNTQTPVALVVDISKVKISLDIPEKYIPKVSLAQEAKITVDAYPQEEFSGTVTKVSPMVSLENRAAPVEITLDNQDQHLKSGMFAGVSLIIEKHPSASVILKEAILGKVPDTYVYVVENNKAVIRKITLGIHSGPYYEVREGIKEGDLVVIVGQQRLYDNAPVTAEVATINEQGESK